MYGGSAASEVAADGQTLTFGWHLANVLDAASRFAVPLFLMLTGALLLGSDKALSVKHLLSRRLPPGSGCRLFSGPLFTGGSNG